MKLTADQLRKLINEEVARVDEAPKRIAKKRAPSPRAKVQSSLNQIVQYLSQALADRHAEILEREVGGIMKEMLASSALSTRELNHMSVAYLQRLDWSQSLKMNLVPELADFIAHAASQLRRGDPNDEE